MIPRIWLNWGLALTLLATAQLSADESAEPANTSPGQIEFRLLGSGDPLLLDLDQLNEERVGKTNRVPGRSTTYFTGIVLSLTPHMTEQGDISYTGTLTRYALRDYQVQPDGSMRPIVSREKVQVEGSLKNHAATSVNFPKQGHTSYFALSDPKRPKEDCEACGPEENANTPAAAPQQ